ncbi:hypothetical protein [Nocardia sp. BMG51109]|uniref:hypothetical protein n=1 Tax=Nocardia sp. BMG51109 TaxID=1056816 RepID=UPI000464C9C4|nr:hypothetical protein [Nocardia sp. BMG51109]
MTDDSRDAAVASLSTRPWVAVGAAAVFAVSVVAAALVFAGYHPGGPYRPDSVVPVPPAADAEYRPGKVPHACAALDLSAIGRGDMQQAEPPTGAELVAGDVADSRLECRADFAGSGVTATVHMEVDYLRDPAGGQARFDTAERAVAAVRTEDIGDMGSGAQAIAVLRDGDSHSEPHVFTTEVYVADGNLFATTTFTVRDRGGHFTGAEVKQQCEHQMRTLLAHLR